MNKMKLLVLGLALLLLVLVASGCFRPNLGKLIVVESN